MAVIHQKLPKLLGREDPLILEVGAHHGTDTLRFLETFPKARVICFEPDPRAAAEWKNRVQHPGATLQEFAIGATDGTLTFHQSAGEHNGRGDGNWDCSGSLRAPVGCLEAYPTITFDTKIDVPVRSLDSWAAEAGIDEIDFIWADVQGAERDLIEGGTETLKRTRFFFTEYYDTEMYEDQWHLSDIVAALPSHTLIKKWKADALFARRSEPRPWLNRLFGHL